MAINDDVTIEGPGVDLLTISVPGNNFNRRAFQISGIANVTLRGMTIQRTGDESGGGIFNLGNLIISDSRISGSNATSISGEG